MKPFRDKFMARWNEKFVAPLEQELGIKLRDYTGLPQGQLTFAVTQNGWNGGDDPTPGLLLLLDTRGRSDLLKTNLAALRKKWTDAGKPMRTETIRGISFSVVPLSSNDVPATLAGIFPKRQPVQELGKENKPPPTGEMVVGQFESLLIVGSSIKVVEPVAARLTGGSAPALADNALFAADQLAHFRNAPLYYGWLNAKTLFDVLAHIPPPEPNPEAPSPMPPIPWDKIFGASGLTGLKSASFSYRQSHDGARAEFIPLRAGNRPAGNFQDHRLRAEGRQPAGLCARRRGEILALAGGRPEILGRAPKGAHGRFPGHACRPQFRDQHRQCDGPAEGPGL